MRNSPIERFGHDIPIPVVRGDGHDGVSSSIDRHLTLRATEAPKRVALIHPRGQVTYGELEDCARRCAGGLMRAGIDAGSRVVLMVRPGPEMLVLAFALMRLRAVTVLVDPGMGRANLSRCLDEVGAETFVGVPQAMFARRFLGWCRTSVRLTVTTGRLPIFSKTTLKKVIAGSGDEDVPAMASDPDETVAILFTSGSTGVPKGVVYTHRMFTAQATLLQDHYGIEAGEVNLATFPLFALYDAVIGMTTIFPDMNFTKPGSVDPMNIIRPIRHYGVTHMFGSPALLERVGRYGVRHRITLPSIRRVLTGGAPVSDKVLARFARLLEPGARIHTPYGATEALPVTSIDHQERAALAGTREGRGICVGRPFRSVEMAVIPITDAKIDTYSADAALPDGEIGEWLVKGDNVSKAYHARPQDTAMAKVPDERGGLFHRTGDVGYRDPQGRFWFCGRKSQRVVTPQGTLHTVACERVFNAHPNVFRTALVGIGEPGDQIPVLCVELERGVRRSARARIMRELLDLAARHAQTESISTVLFHPAFPVDIRHNAKIFREKLALWAGDRLK